jgi:hypothetical protein
MTTPTGEQVEVAIQALRDDAHRWLDMGDQLRAAASAGEGLDLNAFHFSGLGHLLGVDEMYRQVQQTIVTLLRQGAANFDDVAGALRDAADGYEQDEYDTVHRMRNIY